MRHMYFKNKKIIKFILLPFLNNYLLICYNFQSERIILGIKEFEDRRNDIMRKIFSTMDAPKYKEKKSIVEVEDGANQKVF